MASKFLAAACFFFILACLLDSTEGWSGHYVRIRRITGYRRSYCICWYWWWGCSYWRWRWVSYYYYSYRCKAGWTHNGNQNCNIPICRQSCGQYGTCVAPNKCNCDSVATGPTCGTLTCSYRLPCYPGNCYSTNQCECDPGFRSQTRSEGCLSYDETDETMYPTISKCTVTILHVRRAENRTDYMFIMDGTNQTGVEEVWSNQKRFNVLQFEFETEPPDIEDMSERPAYVFASSFGVVEARVEVNLTKISRDGSPIRDSGTFETFSCPHLSDTNPETGTSNCTIYHDQFKTLIEHGDWMEVRYLAKSGGFRELRNIDDRNKHYSTDHFNGLRSIQQVKFLFDFVAPQYCELEGAFGSCPPKSSMLKVEEEFTRNPIKTYWLGWTDDLSGLAEYYVEIFRLLPDPYGRLVERHPLDPLFLRVLPHTDSGIEYPEYTPDRSGIYSVLMETRDKSNNSRIARRLVIYDPTSNITINTEENGKFYVSSASEQSNFQWQTRAKDNNGKSTFTVQWSNHFKNSVHENGRYLNEVLAYPIQFKEIQDDGVLYSQKYVAQALDDYEGSLTREGITNYHGIISFQVRLVYTGDTEVPENGWIDVIPLSETYTFRAVLDDGDSVRIWVRATDVMNNVLADSTLVTLDTTPPGISAINTTQTKLALNYNGDDAKYNYTSRITFEAADGDSGVHEIHYEVVVETFGKNEKVMFKGNQSANFKPEGGVCSSPLDDGYCYRADQTVDLDNCWFMVAKKDLQTSIATVTVTAFNRAMLGTTLKFNIGSINELHGLDSYTGPENFHVEAVSSGGFRLSWTIPDKVSCYGLADIVLLIVSNNKTELVYVPVGATSYEKSTATPNTEYRVSLAMQLQGANRVSSGLELSVRTTEKDKDEGGVPGGVVGGIVVGVIALFAIVLIVFIILVRRGHFQPVRKSVVRAKTIVQRKARETFYGETPHRPHKNEYAYDNRTSELYIYGGMDFDDNQTWHIPRSHVTFETLLKSGRFANIYKAALNRNRKSHETVVAKTLKENFSQDDLMLMKAKINFTATVVGNHPNVVKFIGAVVDDTAMGPFIIYEYCEHGTLKDYLQTQNSNVTVEVQENLFRFGLDIAKGMEFLASKGIVHRRLAARNILLTFLNETKIAGFGPQPSGGSEEDGDSEKGKKERVPIKWMPPECMASTASATEKSDVWSYAVVLWEIFTLGGTPYENIRSRDLPDRLKKGERLHQPEYCDETWYGVMKQCWNIKPDKRPTFYDIRNKLDGLFVASPGDDYYYYKR